MKCAMTNQRARARYARGDSHQRSNKRKHTHNNDAGSHSPFSFAHRTPRVRHKTQTINQAPERPWVGAPVGQQSLCETDRTVRGKNRRGSRWCMFLVWSSMFPTLTDMALCSTNAGARMDTLRTITAQERCQAPAPGEGES